MVSRYRAKPLEKTLVVSRVTNLAKNNSLRLELVLEGFRKTTCKCNAKTFSNKFSLNRNVFYFKDLAIIE